MIIAMFGDEPALQRALRSCRDAGVGPLETYTPAPLEDEPVTSPIPLIVLGAGLIGACCSFGLQAWSSAVAFPFPVGGRPQVAWPSFIPTTWENAALVAILAGFVAFLAINRLPKLYDPIDETAVMRRVSRDRWVLRIDARDSAARNHARAVLDGLDAILIEELP
jgi:Protein of unknown function (DUF3341)